MKIRVTYDHLRLIIIWQLTPEMELMGEKFSRLAGGQLRRLLRAIFINPVVPNDRFKEQRVGI